MSLRHLTAALAVSAGLLAVPGAAHAATIDEYWAEGKAERTAARYHPRYDFTALCQPDGRRGRFWCDLIGRSGSCYITGHADVKGVRRNRMIYWDVWLRAMNRDCY